MTQETPAQTPVYERIYAVVRQVPPGKVVTYGQVGKIIGCTARLVGYALAALRYTDVPDVPWQRVINRLGQISMRDPFGKSEQRKLLEEEGVIFDQKDQVNFLEYGWIAE